MSRKILLALPNIKCLRKVIPRGRGSSQGVESSSYLNSFGRRRSSENSEFDTAFDRSTDTGAIVLNETHTGSGERKLQRGLSSQSLKSRSGPQEGIVSSEKISNLRFSRYFSASYRHENSMFCNADSRKRLRNNFIKEMRILSKLRHPNITTVMGAVIEDGIEPALVMECMERGSLHDLLHNDTIIMEGELLLPILCDIASGVRFLHSAVPKVIHG